MADFTLNCQTDGTANPYTPANCTIQIGALQNTNGTGCKAKTNGTNNQLVHNVAYGSLIQADLTYGATDSGDFLGACVLVRSGGNAFKGYAYWTDGATLARLAKMDGAGNNVDISGTTFTYTPAAGDTLTLIYNTANGALTGKVNGTTQSTSTDTTYQAESTLAAGFWIAAGNINASIVRLFAGTGVSSGPADTLMGQICL